MCCSIIIKFDIISLQLQLLNIEIMFFFPVFFCVTLEFTSICKTKSDEERHEENKPFINQDVEMNAVSREQGKLSTRNMNMYFSLL